MRDFRRLQQDPPQGVNGSPTADNILRWKAVIFGPEDTPWDGGAWMMGRDGRERWKRERWRKGGSGKGEERRRSFFNLDLFWFLKLESGTRTRKPARARELACFPSRERKETVSVVVFPS